jgi:hypothetical protein
LDARLVLVPLPRLLVHEILLRVLPALLLFLGARSLTPWGRLFTSAEQALQPHLQARSYPTLSSRANACGRAAAGWALPPPAHPPDPMRRRGPVAAAVLGAREDGSAPRGVLRPFAATKARRRHDSRGLRSNLPTFNVAIASPTLTSHRKPRLAGLSSFRPAIEGPVSGNPASLTGATTS